MMFPDETRNELYNSDAPSTGEEQEGLLLLCALIARCPSCGVLLNRMDPDHAPGCAWAAQQIAGAQNVEGA